MNHVLAPPNVAKWNATRLRSTPGHRLPPSSGDRPAGLGDVNEAFEPSVTYLLVISSPSPLLPLRERRQTWVDQAGWWCRRSGGRAETLNRSTSRSGQTVHPVCDENNVGKIGLFLLLRRCHLLHSCQIRALSYSMACCCVEVPGPTALVLDRGHSAGTAKRAQKQPRLAQRGQRVQRL